MTIANGFEKPDAPTVTRWDAAFRRPFHSCDQCGEVEVDTVNIHLIAPAHDGNMWTRTSICGECLEQLANLLKKEEE